MATFTAERPQFFEGQYLGADDLAAIVEYLRTTSSRQNLGQHSWGIAIGLDLVSQAVSDTAVEFYVQPGVAVDGYGRIIVVNNPTRIEADQFASIGSGNVDVWIRYDESDFSATRPGFNVCSATDEYARVSEGFEIVVGSKTSILDRQSGVTVNDSLLVDARDTLISVDPDARLLCDASVPHQQFPFDDESAYWLVPLGHVKWSSAITGFLPLIDPAEVEALNNGSGTKTPDQVYEAMMSGRTKRRLLGVVAESVFAADGLLRLRERTATPDPAGGNDAVCNANKPQSSDLYFCDGRMQPKELVWVEGNMRVEGDTRLLNGRLEFKDVDGRDYVERTVDGNLVSAITPALIQRDELNARGGIDLQLLMGKSANGVNRFTVGNIEFDGKDLCDLTITAENKVVIQDNGMLGIGTVNPDSVLESPYTVRGLKQPIIENEGTEDELTYDIFRLESYQADDGNGQWQLDLWDTEGVDRKSLNLTETGLAKSRLYLQSGGHVGIGTTEPTEQLHLLGDDPAVMIDINSNSGLHRTELKFASDGSTEAGMYWNKSSDKMFVHHGGVNSLVIEQEKLGLGTSNPQTTLHIATGRDVALDDDDGYLVIGDVNGANVVFDNNEIQARSNGATSTLFLQHEGGDFSVHRDASRTFRIKDGGNVGIGTSSPAEKLDVRGDIKLGASGDLFAAAGVENLRILAGRIDSAGGVDQGQGFTALRTATGRYTIFFLEAFASPPVVVANSYGNYDNILSVSNANTVSCQISVRDIRTDSQIDAALDDEATKYENWAFTFTAIGPR
ncbi:MAG: hypothetical protein GY916_06910 [Gammaproteobacteria bacterium]|nr:hypothetical protein [Gammaproteobacteria bacterium]